MEFNSILISAMYLPALIGFLASSLTLMGTVWVAFFLRQDILYPPFLYRALFASWFAGFAFYGWAGYLLKSYYVALHRRYLKDLEEAVVEPMEIPLAELKRVAGIDSIKQMEEE